MSLISKRTLRGGDQEVWDHATAGIIEGTGGHWAERKEDLDVTTFCHTEEESGSRSQNWDCWVEVS